MDKILDIVKIGYTLKTHELPGWLRSEIAMGGPGFVINGKQFDWYDYAVQTDRGVKGMLKADVERLLDNAAVINSKLNK